MKVRNRKYGCLRQRAGPAAAARSARLISREDVLPASQALRSAQHGYRMEIMACPAGEDYE